MTEHTDQTTAPETALSDQEIERVRFFARAQINGNMWSNVQISDTASLILRAMEELCALREGVSYE